VAIAGCGGSGNVAPAFDAAAGYAGVTAARARLAAAHERLDRAQAAASARASGDPAVPPELRDAQAAYDQAYTLNQRVLAAFLTTALNEAPKRPETRLALDAFAADAVANARLAVDLGADLDRPAEALGRAERAYGALGLPVPAELAAAGRELRQAAVRAAAATTPTTSRPSPPDRHRHLRR